jgi:hypothetical protein
MVKLVVENDPAEVMRRREFHNVRFFLVKLAANMLRVSRGAGRPSDIGMQCLELLKSFEKYREVVGQNPLSQDIADALNFRNSREANGYPEYENGRTRAIHEILAGSLQYVASEYLNQHPQIATGETQLLEGIRKLEAHHKAERKKWERERMKAARGEAVRNYPDEDQDFEL